MKLLKKILATVFEFRLLSLVGVLMGMWIFDHQSEQNPLSNFLLQKNIYFVIATVALTFRVILWLVLDKANFYNLKNLIGNFIIDIILCTLTMICTVSILFYILQVL